MTGVRLNKLLSKYSRRQVDELLAAGRISINGQKASLGAVIQSPELKNSIVRVDGKIATLKTHISTENNSAFDQKKFIPNLVNEVYVKLWKPLNVTCTTAQSDPHNFLTQCNLATSFPDHRLFTVGRLDKNTTGLILVTSDTRLQSLTLGKGKSEKTYEAVINAMPTKDAISSWSKGMEITVPNKNSFMRIMTEPCKVRQIRNGSAKQSKSIFEFTLHEGKNRQIHRMVNAFGYEVLQLHRLSFAGIKLNGLRGPGDWRELTNEELQQISDITYSEEESERDES